MFPESFGALQIPLNEEKGAHVYVRQDGHTKCLAVLVDGTLMPASTWTPRPSDVSAIWVVFQDTQGLIELLDEATIYFEEEDNA
jgi:hypothetical protein